MMDSSCAQESFPFSTMGCILECSLYQMSGGDARASTVMVVWGLKLRRSVSQSVSRSIARPIGGSTNPPTNQPYTKPHKYVPVVSTIFPGWAFPIVSLRGL